MGARQVFRSPCFKGEALNLAVVRLRCGVTYSHHDDGGHDGDQNAEVLEIDVVDYPEEGALGVAALESGQAERDWRVHAHAEESQRKTHQHGPKRALGVEPLEEDTEEKDDEDGRGQIALHGLQVGVKSLRVFDDGDPSERD